MTGPHMQLARPVKGTLAMVARALRFAFMLLVVSLGFEPGLFARDLDRYVNNKEFSWEMESTTNFIIYFEENTRAAREIDQLKAKFERSLRTVKQLLGATNYLPRTRVFVVDSKERKKQLMGDDGWGGAIPKLHVVFCVFNKHGNGCSTHEICHVVARNLWGKPERWIDEGLATYADGRWRDRVHGASRELEASGRLLSLEQLFKEFPKHPEEVGYVQAGSFVAFIHAEYGMEVVRKIWQSGHVHIPQITGRKLRELEIDWHKRVQAELSASQEAK